MFGPNASKLKTSPFVDRTNQPAGPIVIDDSMESSSASANRSSDVEITESFIINELKTAQRESEKEDIFPLWKKPQENQAVNPWRPWNPASTSGATAPFQTARDSLSGDETEDDLILDDSDSDIEILSHANKVNLSSMPKFRGKHGYWLLNLSFNSPFANFYIPRVMGFSK